MGNSLGRPSSATQDARKTPYHGNNHEPKNLNGKGNLDHGGKRNHHQQRVEFDLPENKQEKREVGKSPVIQRHLRDPDPIVIQEGSSQNKSLLIPTSELQVPEFLSISEDNERRRSGDRIYKQGSINGLRTPGVINKKLLYSSVEDVNPRLTHPKKNTPIEKSVTHHSRSMNSLIISEVEPSQKEANDFIDQFGAFTLTRKYKTENVEKRKRNVSYPDRLAPGVTTAGKYALVNKPSRNLGQKYHMKNESHINGLDDDSLQSVSSISNTDPSNSFSTPYSSQSKYNSPLGYDSPDSTLGYFADSSVNNPGSSRESSKKITIKDSLQAQLRQRVQDYERSRHFLFDNQVIHYRHGSDSTTISDQSIFGEGISSVTRPHFSNYTHVNSLQDGILLKVFSYLNTMELCRVSGVCKRWQTLAWDPILWNTIEIVNYKESDINRVLRNLLGTLAQSTQGYCLTVHHVKLSGCELVSDKALGSIARLCIDLEHLDLDGCCCITSKGLQDLLLNCHGLSHLNLSGCTCVNSLSMPNVNGFSLENNGTFLKLRHLDLSDCVAFDDFGLRTLGLTCGMLETLYLRRCSRITDVGIKHVANHCHHLKELSTSDCYKIRDFSLKEIGKSSPGLKYLSVAKCPVSDTGIKYIGRHCVRLKYLNVRGCESISDIGIAYVVQNCLKLRSMDIGKCNITDSILHTIGIHCPQLKKLSIRGCLNLTDEGIRSIATQCCNLQYFNVQECNLNFETFAYIREHCRNCIIEHTCPAFF